MKSVFEANSLFFQVDSIFYLFLSCKCNTMGKMRGYKVGVMLFWMAVLFSACRHDVDFLANYREVPIIYGLLEANADTNFVKITRAFYAQDDPIQVAMNPDSSNYPGRLDVRLTEFCNGEKTREIILDTITLHNKQQGTFYAPDQKLYYTTERLRMNMGGEAISYQLAVVLPDSTLHARTDIVGARSFKVKSLAVNYSLEYFGTRHPLKFHPAVNAGIYDVSFSFTFKEQRTPDGDSVPRTMYWEGGRFTESDLALHPDDDGDYVITYKPETFYEILTNFLGGDTAIAGLHRFISDYPVEITVTAGGHNLQQYIYFNAPENMVTPGDNEFTLIDGGYGVFSSRMTTKRKVRLAGTTVPDLLAKTNWGFKYIGGEN
jgi:hypothetical protein